MARLVAPIDARRRRGEPVVSGSMAALDWLIWGAQIALMCLAVTIGAAAVMVIAFALFWPAIGGALDVAARWTAGGYP